MTKDQYFDMCEMMGSEPVDSEVPIEYEDLPEEVQEGIQAYNMFQDNWDTMNGIYMGKNYYGLKDVLDILGVEDHRSCYYIMNVLDRNRSEILNAKKSAKK